MKMYGLIVSVCFLLMGFFYPCTSHPHCPQSPTRLNGRPLDWLSDEMMTPLWEVIPKWEVSDKDCTPLSVSLSLSLAAAPSSSSSLLAEQMMIDSPEKDHRKQPLISLLSFLGVLLKIFIYPYICGAQQDSPHMGKAISGIIHTFS